MAIFLIISAGILIAVYSFSIYRRRSGLHRQEQMDAHEEPFRTLADAIPQLCWMANTDGWIFWYNRRWYEYTGTTQDQMEGWGWQSVHDPEKLPAVQERWQTSIQTGTPFEMTFPLRGADGVFKSFLTRIIPLKGRDGKVYRWFGTNTEITVQTEAEQALRRSEERLLLAQQVARVGTFDWNIVTGLNQWTPEMEAMYGLAPGEFAMTKQAWEKLVHPEDLEQANEAVRLSLQTGHFEGEWRTIWRDGSVHWLYGRGSVFKDADGNPIQMIGVNIDLTERKLAEQALRETENRYKTLAEALPAIIFTSVNGKTSYVNRRWQEYTGLNFEQSAATNFQGSIHQEDLPALDVAWRDALAREAAFESEFRLRRADGVYRWFRCRAVPLRDAPGQSVQWLGVSSDVDDEKRAAERLRQSQKMEAMGRLAGGIAHDFNNLLTAITGYNGLLMEQLEPGTELADYAAQVHGAAERAAGLTQQLLTFSRRDIFQARLLRINDAVLNIRNLLARVIGEDIRIVTELSPDTGLIRIDPVQLDQALMNLAVNARDAMPQGGTLTFATTTAREAPPTGSGESAVQDYVVLSVRDTGCGISPEVRARLFEPFFTTKETGKGTGLGLSIVYGVAQQSGGYITVDSELGKGSTFRLFFPRSESADVGNTTDQSDVVRSGDATETILLVEDDPAIRQFATEALRREGYRILQSAGPLQALNMLETCTEKIHLLLTDVLMPEMRGTELAQRVCQLRPGTLVLYMSGYSDSTFLKSDAIRGARFLQKPFRVAALTQATRECFSRGTQSTQ